MLIKSKLIERGSTDINGNVFSKDCKISFGHGGIMFKNHFDLEPIGIVNEIIDDGTSIIVEGKITNSKIRVRLSIRKKIINWLCRTFLIPEPYKNFVDLFNTVGFGGLVRKRDGNMISEFDLREISLLSRRNG